MMRIEISNDIRNATKEVLGIGDLVVKERQVNLSRKDGQLEKKRDEEFFVVEQIMENGNIKLRDWNTNTIEDETIPPKQLKKMYLENMKMEDIEKNFKKCKIVEDEKMEMTTITETTPTTSLTRNKLINQMTTTLIANSQDMDMLDSPTISMTSSLTVTLTESTEEYQMFTIQQMPKHHRGQVILRCSQLQTQHQHRLQLQYHTLRHKQFYMMMINSPI